MDEARRSELERIMTALGAGDRAMVVALHTAFGVELRRALVGLAREAGLPLPPGDDLDGLAIDACFALADVARAWRPDGGALPWVWARHRLLRVLREHAGPPCDRLAEWELDNMPDDRVVAATDDDADDGSVLRRLAEQRADAAMVRDALALVVPPRDVALFLAHAAQVADGDPSPSVTVAALTGRSPGAVRKAVQRGRQRLSDLAARDDGFRPLLELPLLGPCRQEAA